MTYYFLFVGKVQLYRQHVSSDDRRGLQFLSTISASRLTETNGSITSDHLTKAPPYKGIVYVKPYHSPLNPLGRFGRYSLRDPALSPVIANPHLLITLINRADLLIKATELIERLFRWLLINPAAVLVCTFPCPRGCSVSSAPSAADCGLQADAISLLIRSFTGDYRFHKIVETPLSFISATALLKVGLAQISI